MDLNIHDDGVKPPSSLEWRSSVEDNLGPVYTTVEKSTGHKKKRRGVSQLWLVEMQLLTGGCLH